MLTQHFAYIAAIAKDTLEIYRICERLLKLCDRGMSPESSRTGYNNLNEDEDSTMEEGVNFTRNYLAFRLDNKGSKILNFNSTVKGVNNSNQSTPSDSIMATRR